MTIKNGKVIKDPLKTLKIKPELGLKKTKEYLKKIKRLRKKYCRLNRRNKEDIFGKMNQRLQENGQKLMEVSQWERKKRRRKRKNNG